MAYLCFDIGSSSLKAAIVSEAGKLLGIARRPLAIRHGQDGAHEADADSWTEAAFSAGAEAIAAAKRAAIGSIGPSLEVRAIAVSGNGPSLLAVDDSGLPLGPALSWLDRRAVAEAAEVSAIAGAVIDPSFYLPKALRLWRSGGEVFRRRLRWFFSCPEYLVFVLCGEALTYLPAPGYEPYIWNASMIEALGLPADRFPSFAAPGRIVGKLLPAAAERLGCDPGAPLVSGYPDFLAAIVGSASIDIGVACDRTGTSEAINLCAPRPFPSRDLLSLPHPVPGLWNLSGGVSTAGAALEWLSGLLGSEHISERRASIGALLAEARRSPPGARGLIFLPYLAGERAPLWDASRRGAFVGLTIDHGKADLARAVCESLAYGLKLASDLALAEGFSFRLARVSGLSASDEILCEIKADVLGVPFEVPEIAECELVGVAAACALALGEAAGISEAALSLVRFGRRFEPQAVSAYSEAFSSFKEALVALRPLDVAAASRNAPPAIRDPEIRPEQ
jgi:xylulokinase